MTKTLYCCHTHTSSGAIAYTASPGAGNTVPLLFSNVRCAGSESLLTTCPYDSNLGDCTLSQPAAGVTCHMCKPGYSSRLSSKKRSHSCAFSYIPLKKLCSKTHTFVFHYYHIFDRVSRVTHWKLAAKKGLGEVELYIYATTNHY